MKLAICKDCGRKHDGDAVWYECRDCGSTKSPKIVKE